MRLRSLSDHVRESSESEEQTDDRHDLREIKEEDAFQGVFGPVPELTDEQDGRERRDSEIADETVDFYKCRAGDVEDDEDDETEKRVYDRQGNYGRGVRIHRLRIGVGDAERKVRWLSVDLPSDERSQVADDAGEEER